MIGAFIFKEWETVKVSKIILTNIILIAFFYKIEMPILVTLLLYIVYTTETLITFTQDGMQNIQLFLLGDTIFKILQQRVVARILILLFCTFPSLIVYYFIHGHDALITFPIVVMSSFVNILYTVGIKYKNNLHFMLTILLCVLPCAGTIVVINHILNRIAKYMLILIINILIYIVSAAILKVTTLENVINSDYQIN